jgi:hypothetical protein
VLTVTLITTNSIFSFYANLQMNFVLSLKILFFKKNENILGQQEGTYIDKRNFDFICSICKKEGKYFLYENK